MNFYDCIKEKKVMIFDGGMGTELANKGLEMSGINNLTNPDLVRGIHEEYVRAGADVIITNTLTMNRISLESHGSQTDVREVNAAGARLAREAAGNEKLVFGDISTTGQFLEPYGEYTEKQFYDNFKEQAAILAEGGVDGYIIETISDLREAICALKACKDAAGLPVIISLSFSSTDMGGTTMMGNTVAEIAKAAEENGADAVGANCGDLDPGEMAEIAGLYRAATALPVIIQPNAGKPILHNNQATFQMGPDDFTDGMIKCIAKGATIVGGCCGTGPEHIRVLAEKIKRK